jgi:RNA polymerase sigma-70 factor (ECF subfamily)
VEGLEPAKSGRVMVEQGDHVLIEEIRAGSTGAFEKIMKRYERLVYLTCFPYAGSRDDALDITQNVFVKVYENAGSFQGTGSFKAWLLSITHNEGLNWVRGHARHRDHAELTPANSPEVAAHQDSDLIRQETWEMLREALLHLNPRQRQAVVLRYFERTPVREIAAILDCTEGTAKSILFRSLRELRRYLVPHWRES